jgi:hypothetical protein
LKRIRILRQLGVDLRLTRKKDAYRPLTVKFPPKTARTLSQTILEANNADLFEQATTEEAFRRDLATSPPSRPARLIIHKLLRLWRRRFSRCRHN